jgi:hypothetical protein
VLALASSIVSLGAVEIALRMIYRGGSQYTLGAPGTQPFEHLMLDPERRLRSRFETGPKSPGVPRVMVLGDSITWGYGVRNWEDTWPEQLARRFDQQGPPHQFAVLAYPSREIDAHLAQWMEWADRVQPDALVYQWYANDIEVIKHRPEAPEPSWRSLAWHGPLRRRSYLYAILDDRLGQLVDTSGPEYLRYLIADFAPGTKEWAEFERVFHGLAARAAEVASTRILVLYPQVPFTGSYPLEPVHQRMRDVASARAISIPPPAWFRQAGAVVARPDSRWKSAIRVPVGAGALAVVTGAYYAKGTLDLSISFAAPSGAGGRLATVRLLEPDGPVAIASAALEATNASASGLQVGHVRLDIPGDVGRDLRIAIGDTTRELEIASIDLPVAHDFEVVDLTAALNGFNAHVSAFDAHPNPRAQRVIADAVFDALTAREHQGRD